MNSFFKIVASPLMTLEAPLTFGSLSVMALARTLYQDHQTTLFVHGSSVESLLNDSSKYPLADLDLVAWSTPETCLQPIQTINTFFGKHLIPLINSNTRSVFAYHLKDSSLAGTQTKFSMTLYIQPPPTEIFDDIVHSSMLRLTPDIQLVYKYPDTKLTQTCKKENLLFSPYRSVINKHFFRTAMREAKGWNALYNPELDLRIYHNLYISINDPFLFKKEFIQAFDEHFNSQDTDSFNRMLFFSLSRIARHAGIPYAEQFFETIKDIFKESKKPSYIHFSSFITHIQTNNLIPDWNVFLQNSYSQTNAVSIFQLANLVENSESALGKQDIYHDFSQAICKHLHLPFPIPYALNQPTTSYVLDAFEHATTPPTDFLSNIIHPILSSMSSEKRSEILTKWMRLKKIHLNYAESFLSTTPDLLPSYLNYLSTLMARQNRPSFYIKRKFEQYSLISLPPVPQALQTIPHTTQSELGLTDTASISSRSDSPQAHLPDPTFELDRPTA